MKLVAYENSNSLAYVFSPLVLEPHVLENIRRENTGKRHRVYEIKVMADIERYANNRKGLKG